MKKIGRRILAIICIMCLVMPSLISFQKIYKVEATQKFKIHFIDVGCGDGALLQYGEGKTAKYALIDAGAKVYNETSSKEYGKKKTPVYNYLKKLGVKHLEFVILTHPHEDHIGGMISIINDTSIKIDKIYGNDLNFEYKKSSDDPEKQSSDTAKWTTLDLECYKEFKNTLKKRNENTNQDLHIPYIVPKAGDVIYLGTAKITFYGTLENDYSYGRQGDFNVRQVNKYSIVTKINYGHKNNGKIPAKAVIRDLSKLDIYQTSDRGTIVVASDGSKLSIQTEKGKNQPSIVGGISSSGDIISSPLLSSIDFDTNMKDKIKPIETNVKNKSKIYKKKQVKVKFGASARSFTSLKNVQYKFVKQGQNEGKISYKIGKQIAINQEMGGVLYIRYTTSLGAKTIKLPEIIVDGKAPTKARIVKKKTPKYEIFKFQADYGISGKKKTQYKLVPKGKKESKYHWVNANSLKYQARYKKSKLYVRFIDNAGNMTVKKKTI